MSIVNVKLIFAKKQKQTRERLTQGRGRKINHDRNGCFHTTGGCEIRYPFDNSRQIGNTS